MSSSANQPDRISPIIKPMKTSISSKTTAFRPTKSPSISKAIFWGRVALQDATNLYPNKQMKFTQSK